VTGSCFVDGGAYSGLGCISYGGIYAAELD